MSIIGTDLDTIRHHLARSLGAFGDRDPAAEEEIQRAAEGLEERLRGLETRLRALETSGLGAPDREGS